jgi:hypothetical protein
METFDGNPDIFTKQHAGDDALFVVFYMGTLKNEEKSIEAGRPIIDDVECVRIIVPGDKNNQIDRPATSTDKARFAKQYAMFSQGLKEEDQISGTRLTEWPFLSRGQCEEFRYLGIRTVEQLAEVRDDIVSKVPGLVTLKQNAAVWLGKAKSSAEAAKHAKLMTDQQQQIENLKEVVRDQGKRIEDLLTGARAKA